MLRTLAVIPLLFLAGCNLLGGEDEKPRDGGITAGLFELRESFQYNGLFYTMADQVQLAAAGQYHASGYLNDVLFREAKGIYRVDGKHMVFMERTSRQLNELNQMGPWQGFPDSRVEVRNITATSFQMWQDAIPELGLIAGWRTYNRLGG